uniref:MADS-box domain-containing protein n=1 Tax=Picea sitchensis TaxID=3332 RepID=A9P1V3_PICSI|nr:unknown [Picea sitchensis]
MGKKKVELKRIQNPISRHATFYKRKGGLLKKAFELSVLCDAEVALIIFSETGKIYEFASHNDPTTILAKYGRQMETTRNARPSSLQNTENIVGEDLESLTMKELDQLEKQLRKSTRRICDRKMKIFSQSSKLLEQQVRSLEEENTELHTKFNTTGDSSTSAPDLFIRASVPKTQLHLGRCDENRDDHSFASELQ